MSNQLGINPWRKIWRYPRETIRAIVAYNTGYLLPLLYWIYGFSTLLHMSQSASLGVKLSVLEIIGGCAIFAILSGFIGINVGALLLYWTGRWLGGRGPYKEIRAATAWAAVPSLVGSGIWLFLAGVFGRAIFTQQFTMQNFIGKDLAIVSAAALISLIFAIWSLVILLRSLAEVQQFSIWKAIFNAALSILVVIVLLRLIGWLLSLMVPGSVQ